MPKNKKILILVAEQFQDLEVWYPFLRFKEEKNIQVDIAGMGEKYYTGKYGLKIKTCDSIDNFNAKDYDAVVIPGGWAPDYMRRSPLIKDIVKLVRDMNKANKVIAAICHGGWILASADIIKGRTITAFHAIKDDLVHAGAKFVDKEVAVDKNIITSRNPFDLPAFCKEIIDKL